MNIQRKNSAHHFRMQSEREQTLALFLTSPCNKLGPFAKIYILYNLKKKNSEHSMYYMNYAYI